MNYPYYGFQSYTPQETFRLPYSQQSTTQDERVWVPNREAADAYLMAPNSFVRLWNSSVPEFYEKRTDASGRPYTETFEYKRKEQISPQNLTQDEQSESVLAKKIDGIEKRLAALEGERNVSESHADDEPVQSVSEPVSRRSKARSTESA